MATPILLPTGMLMPPSADPGCLMVACEHDPVGTGRQIELTAVALRDAGWRVLVACVSAGGSLASRLVEAGIEVSRLSHRPQPDASALPRLLGLIRRERPAVVLGWGRETLPAVAATRLLASAGGLQRWRHLHLLSQPPRGRVEIAAARAADGLLVTADSIAGACGALGLASRTTVVPPAAASFSERGERSQLAVRLGLDPAKPWMLCVAPLVAPSRLERLLWGIDQMGVVRQDVEYVIVGRGRLRRRLQRRARVEEVDGWLHWFDQLPCLPELVPHVQVLFQPGSVAYGGCLPEGLAHGIPAVVTDSAEYRELLGDDEAGRLVPTVPESEFARRAIELLENKQAADACREAARKRVASIFEPTKSLAAVVAAIQS